jgi:hypothetical protein
MIVTWPVFGAGWSVPVFSDAASRCCGGGPLVEFVPATWFVVVGFTSPITLLSVLLSPPPTLCAAPSLELRIADSVRCNVAPFAAAAAA